MPALVTPQQRSQSARAISSLRVVPKVRVSCWRRPGWVSLGRHPDSDLDLGLGDIQAGDPFREQRLVSSILPRWLLR